MFAAATYVQSQRNAGLTLKQIAGELNMNYNTLRRKWSEHIRADKPAPTPPKERQIPPPLSVLDRIIIPSSQPTLEDKPLTAPYANCLVLGDLHIPHHNQLMLRRAIAVTQKYHPTVKTIIVGGDIFDFASLSQYSHNQPEADPNATVRLAGDVLRAVFQHFDTAYICSGNHDERFSKRLDRAWDLQLLINAAMGRNWPDCDVKVSNLDYIYVGDTWIVGHPSHYSGLGGKTPSELADLYQRNVVTFHNHVVGMSQSKTGKYIGIDAGHVTEPGQHYYQYRRLTKFARWNAGFCVLANGFPHLYTEAFTDWIALGC